MKGVQVNAEERDKKFAQKYWVKELPHPFKNIKQFEALMHVPIGKDWNTIQSHKRLIQPEVLTKAGQIIKPLKYKKDLPLQTIEALVEHRAGKKESRPAAKF
jgi:U3 small nucleolar RNA-associated protein 14